MPPSYSMPCRQIPLWHWVFGEDITAWSIPHLILLTSFILTQLLALWICTYRPGGVTNGTSFSGCSSATVYR